MPIRTWNDIAVKNAANMEVMSLEVSSRVKKYTTTMSRGPRIIGMYSIV
jgi:hypothetical protein